MTQEGSKCLTNWDRNDYKKRAEMTWVWTKARSTLALPVEHCRRTLKGSLEQNDLFVWDSCLRWFMGGGGGVNNKNIVHSKSRLP